MSFPKRRDGGEGGTKVRGLNHQQRVMQKEQCRCPKDMIKTVDNHPEHTYCGLCGKDFINGQ